MRWIVVVALVVSLPSALAAQDRVAVHPPNSPIGPFTPAIKAGGLVFVSGQIGNLPGTRAVVPGGVAAETRQVMENMRVVLEVAGTSFARVVKCLVFLTDINDFAAMNAVYAPYFPGDPPARSTVAVAALVLGAHVEIECIALGG